MMQKMQRQRKQRVHPWCPTTRPFWKAQADLCALRRDFYQMLARNSEVPLMRNDLFGALASYCRMQASSCDLQMQVCRMFAKLSI